MKKSFNRSKKRYWKSIRDNPSVLRRRFRQFENFAEEILSENERDQKRN